LEKDYNHQPTVTVMVVAHNEEKVILEKLNNILELDYPQDKLRFWLLPTTVQIRPTIL